MKNQTVDSGLLLDFVLADPELRALFIKKSQEHIPNILIAEGSSVEEKPVRKNKPKASNKLKGNEKACATCKAPFIPSRKTQRFCSGECRTKGLRKGTEPYKTRTPKKVQDRTELRQKILKLVQSGPKTTRDLRKKLGTNEQKALWNTMYTMKQNGLIKAKGKKQVGSATLTIWGAT